MKKDFIEQERVLLDFVNPRNGCRNQIALVAYDGDKAAIMWYEEKEIYDPFQNKTVKEWWEKDWWCYESWEQAEMAIIYMNGDKNGSN